MTDKIQTPQSIGSKWAAILISCGLAAASLEYSAMGGFNAPMEFVSKFYASVFTSVVIFFILGWLFGSWLGSIVSKRSWTAPIIAPIFSFIILMIGTAASASLNYLAGMEGAADYIVKPVGLVTIFGSLPTLVLGLIWGKMTQKNIQKLSPPKEIVNEEEYYLRREA